MANKNNKKNGYVFGQGQKKALNHQEEFIYGVHYFGETSISLKDNKTLKIHTPTIIMNSDDKEAIRLIMRANDRNRDNNFLLITGMWQNPFIRNFISFFTRCVKEKTIFNKDYFPILTSKVANMLYFYLNYLGKETYNAFKTSAKEIFAEVLKEHPNDECIKLGIELFDGILERKDFSIDLSSIKKCS